MNIELFVIKSNIDLYEDDSKAWSTSIASNKIPDGTVDLSYEKICDDNGNSTICNDKSKLSDQNDNVCLSDAIKLLEENFENNKETLTIEKTISAPIENAKKIILFFN